MSYRQDGPMLRDRVHLQALTAALTNLATQGDTTPCAGRPEWISERPEDIETAKAGCARCPIITVCRTVGVGQYAGVWGGRLHRKAERDADDIDSDEALSA